MASSSSSFLGIDDTVDDFYFSVVSDDETDPDFPVTDDRYAEALQFQETLLASLITSHRVPSSSMTMSPPPLSLHWVASSSQNDELLFEETLMASSSTLPPPFVASSSKAVDDTVITEKADQSSIIVCEICTEAKRTHEMFRNQRCYHSFCSECVVKQVSTKIQDNITNVSCPGLNCKGLLELESCRSLLPKALIDRWDDALSEALLLTVPKFYCPFKDCSAMLLGENEGVGDIRESECPFCHRLFCARCYVPWHPGVGCEEYQKMNPDERGREDLLVKELAKQKKWKRCPRCKFYVEKRDGCLHITCRCKFEFCYACGERWTASHGGCQ
ncbi:E3 ubiquitin-protein ligase RSL1-like [Trifolium pratense]|uniref:E3 ubiquitin-protein ligase RSL1-like n=1 Tax=Trifolium pratense TaxID=57577 RepID=UPI001E695B8C|nr:E3 ubiquitin-protein ligase RSL1-like [Trifolium pratense]